MRRGSSKVNGMAAAFAWIQAGVGLRHLGGRLRVAKSGKTSLPSYRPSSGDRRPHRCGSRPDGERGCDNTTSGGNGMKKTLLTLTGVVLLGLAFSGPAMAQKKT